MSNDMAGELNSAPTSSLLVETSPSARPTINFSSDEWDRIEKAYRVRRSRRSALCDWNRVEGNWKQVKGKVKEKWGKLTDDDLNVIDGKRDQLEGKIQERYGYAKDQTKKDIDDWVSAQHW